MLKHPFSQALWEHNDMASKPSPPEDAGDKRPPDHLSVRVRAIKLATFYAILALLWIYASDALITQFTSDPALLSRLQTLKGIFFIAITSLLFYYVVRNSLTSGFFAQAVGFTDTGEPASSMRPSLFVPLIAFLLLALTIATGGYLVFDRYEASIRSAVATQMETVAMLKKRQIEEWLDGQRNNSRTMTDNPLFFRRVEQWLARGAPDDTDGRSILERFSNLVRTYNYRGVHLIDRQGRLRLSVGISRQFGPDFQPILREALTSGSIVLDDIHWEADSTGRHPELGLIAPFPSGSVGSKESSCAVYLSIDPAKKLFPLIQTWPNPSPTAESLVVRREGNEVVFLNELRHQKNTALSLRFPVDTPYLPAAIASRGKTGLVEGNDYRGVPVVTFVTRVNGAPWLLVTKVDKAEILAPIHRQQRLVTTLVIVFTTVAGLVILLWWRQQHARITSAFCRSELERRSLTSRLDDITRNAYDIILLYDKEGRIVDANDRAIEVYGYERELLFGMTGRDLRAPEALADIGSKWDRIVDGEGACFETVHRRSDGSVFPVEVCTRLITIDSRTFRQSIIRDISERKRAEETLKMSEQRFRALSEQFHTLLDAIPDCIFLTSGNRISWANKATTRQYGADLAGFEGTFCFHTLQKRAEPCEECPALRAIASSQTENTIITTTDNRTIDLRTVPVFDADGQVRGVIEIGRDITEQRRTEEQLRHAQKMEAIGTLAGGIAHDFNNILTSVIGYGSLLLMKMAESDPLRSNVSHILTAADRAAALTQGLLAYSRKEASDLRSIDLNDIIKRVDRFLSRIIGEDVEMTVIPADAPLTVLGDAGQLEQVLMNLATNARDAMPGGGSLLIESKEADIDESFISFHGFGTAGSYALITVSDTGNGIEEATREHIFEPFFTTKEVGKGTGLGLAIAYGIVKQHRGFINVYSEPGKGTTFRLYFPLTGIVPQDERKTAPLPARGKGETILVVEDSEHIRDLLRELLSECGYRVIEAADGEEGVERFREKCDEVDLVLMDVIMPRKNGKEAFDEIRAIDPEVKTLFMSGYTADVISRKGIDAAGLDLVTKPVTPGALLAKIREVLDK
jgi:PAS domain S-box-containing protein